MREESIDEFESIFERASIPVFDIPEVPLTDIAIVLDGAEPDTSVAVLGAYLKGRFGSRVRVHWPAAVPRQTAVDIAEKNGLEAAEGPHESTLELVHQLNASQCALILLSEGKGPGGDVATLDHLVEAAKAPVLIVRKTIAEPESVFANVLHSLTGNLKNIDNLAYSFTLAEDQGSLVLVHTVEEAEVGDVRDTLRVSPEISEASGDALIENLKRHAERYLKGVVASSRDEPYHVSYHLRVGGVLDSVQDDLALGDYGVLVVGSHHEGRSHVKAVEFQLMHSVQDIPVLAL